MFNVRYVKEPHIVRRVLGLTAEHAAETFARVWVDSRPLPDDGRWVLDVWEDGSNGETDFQTFEVLARTEVVLTVRTPPSVTVGKK